MSHSTIINGKYEMPCHQSHGEHYCKPTHELPKGSIVNLENQKGILTERIRDSFQTLVIPKFVTENQIQPRAFITQNGFYNICVMKNSQQGGTITYVLSDERSTIYISDIFVSDECRRKGLGTYLLYLLALDANYKRCHTITLDSVLDADNTFYERLGFQYTQDMDNEMRIKTRDLLRSNMHNSSKIEKL